jgi:acyl-CoA-binding protein
MQDKFDAAAERVRNQPGPDNDEMLELYGLFKQATVGDNNTREWVALLGVSAVRLQLFGPKPCRRQEDNAKLAIHPNTQFISEIVTVFGAVGAAKPGLLDLKGKKKWEAWNSRKGKTAAAPFFHRHCDMLLRCTHLQIQQWSVVPMCSHISIQFLPRQPAGVPHFASCLHAALLLCVGVLCQAWVCCAAWPLQV